MEPYIVGGLVGFSIGMAIQRFLDQMKEQKIQRLFDRMQEQKRDRRR